MLAEEHLVTLSGSTRSDKAGTASEAKIGRSGNLADSMLVHSMAKCLQCAKGELSTVAAESGAFSLIFLCFSTATFSFQDHGVLRFEVTTMSIG